MAKDPGTAPRVRLAFRIGYVGTAFFGSQSQPGKRTVEGEIEAACMRAGLIQNKKESNLALSGRTDRGVHARCQILAFSTSEPDRAIRALNGQLPPDIWATSWSFAHPEFYPRYDIINRTYRYYFSEDPTGFQDMEHAAPLFLGQHDFSCFARIEPGKNPIKTIDRIEMKRDQQKIWLEITAKSFLWHMVRSIASALLSIAEERMTVQDLERYFNGKCKNKINPSPPDGLILWEVTTDLFWSEMVIPKIKRRNSIEAAAYHRLMGTVYSLLEM